MTKDKHFNFRKQCERLEVLFGYRFKDVQSSNAECQYATGQGCTDNIHQRSLGSHTWKTDGSEFNRRLRYRKHRTTGRVEPTMTIFLFLFL